MATAESTLDEFCPSCGSWAEYLSPTTGFCASCTLATTGKKECKNCGREFVPSQNSRTICIVCERIRWFERNADAIERVMAYHNISVAEAIVKVHDDNRPRCAMCGDKLKHGTKLGSREKKFCNKRDECRRASIRYRNYRKRNGMSEESALERAIHGKR